MHTQEEQLTIPEHTVYIDVPRPTLIAPLAALSMVEGATMRQRSGTVESWLSKMSSGQISSLITKLQKR